MSREIGISSREVSIGIYSDTVRVAQIGVPGPQGGQGERGPQGQPGVGNYQGTYNNSRRYDEGDIVAYDPGDGTGLYFCKLTTGATGGINPSNTNHWDLVSSPGAQGDQGPEGPQGEPGEPGADGEDGADGAPGIIFRGVWQSGAAYEIHDVVVHDGSAWICIEAHDPAVENPYDEQAVGLNYWQVLAAGGRDGTDGTDGTDGKTVRSGSGSPAGSLGVVGDFYIDKDDLKVWGPKTASGWGTGTSMVGEDALSWLAFHFEASGTRRLVVPEASTIYLDDIVTHGTGSVQVYVNGGIETGIIGLSRNDRIAVVANNVSGDYLVTIRMSGPQV